jgi:branched-chain amino acid transport system substrate-binding protein
MKQAFLLLVISLAQPACADVTIGLIMPQTGPYAVFGEQARRGARQAVADINGKGGLFGQKVKLAEADDACDPKQAVSAASQLASKGVRMAVGPFCSGAAIAASKIFLDENAVLISPSATNPRFTDEGGPGIFRVCGRDDQQGPVIAETILKELKDKKLAILHDKSAGGRGLADAVKQHLNAAGFRETLFEAITPGDKDYSATVTNLKKRGIELIVFGGYHTEAGLLLRQLRAAGSPAQLFGNDALMTTEFWSIAGPAAEGALMTFGPDPRKRPDAQGAVEALRAAGFDPEGYTLYTYAAVQVLAEAAGRAGAAAPEKIIPIMHKENFATVLGHLAFNRKGDIVGPGYVVYQWHDGKYAERHAASGQEQ